MTGNDQPQSEQQLQAYQDGLLNEAEREAFRATLGDRPEVAASVQLQSEVDQSLRRMFQPPVPPQELVSEASPPRHVNGVPRLRSRPPTRWLAALTTVALVAWGLVAWQLHFGGDASDQPFFEPRPLVEIYRETIARGFNPYYECRDDERFAFTFELRQGRRLRLTRLPEGRRMLGLSYSGGLSRDTTAMLCIVDDLPVMVFVDRIDSDLPQLIDETQSQVKIMRRELAGLVLYEITPHSEAQILAHLVVSDE